MAKRFFIFLSTLLRLLRRGGECVVKFCGPRVRGAWIVGDEAAFLRSDEWYPIGFRAGSDVHRIIIKIGAIDESRRLPGICHRTCVSGDYFRDGDIVAAFEATHGHALGVDCGRIGAHEEKTDKEADLMGAKQKIQLLLRGENSLKGKITPLS